MMAEKHLRREAFIEMLKGPTNKGDNATKNKNKNKPKRKSESFERNKERSPKSAKDDNDIGRMPYQPLRRFTNYLSLTAHRDHIFAVIDQNMFRAPSPLKGPKEKRDPKKFCRFHKETSHYTVDC